MFPFTRTVLFSRCVCGAYREERACGDFGSVHLCSSRLRAVGRQRIPQTLRVRVRARAQPAPFAASFILRASPPLLSPGEGTGSRGGCGEPQEEGQRASCTPLPAPALRFLVPGWACVSAATSVFAADGADSLCKLSAPSLPTLRAGRSEASSRHGHARSCGLRS